MDKRGEKRLNRLFAVARNAGTYTESLENGFEARLLARISSEREERASAVLFLALYSIFSPPPAQLDLGAALLDGCEESILVDFLTETMAG
jgi:hypothetical protein